MLVFFDIRPIVERYAQGYRGGYHVILVQTEYTQWIGPDWVYETEKDALDVAYTHALIHLEKMVAGFQKSASRLHEQLLNHTHPQVEDDTP